MTPKGVMVNGGSWWSALSMPVHAMSCHVVNGVTKIIHNGGCHFGIYPNRAGVYWGGGAKVPPYALIVLL